MLFVPAMTQETGATHMDPVKSGLTGLVVKGRPDMERKK